MILALPAMLNQVADHVPSDKNYEDKYMGIDNKNLDVSSFLSDLHKPNAIQQHELYAFISKGKATFTFYIFDG